jgi:tetratricopeptide (TPR) repeat protein
MASKEKQIKAYVEDSLYKRMISVYQNGEWEEAGKRLKKLMKKYPGEAELNSLATGISLRLNMDSEATEEAEQAKKKSIRRIIYLSIALAIVVTVSVAAYDEYSTQVQQQIEEINLGRSLDAKFQDVQNFLQAGRPVEAIALISEISSIDASYPRLDEAIVEAEILLELENMYEQAATQYAGEDFSGALETLMEIFEREPNFRDVEIQINSLELKRNLSAELLASADEAYLRGDWTLAISNFEGAIENDSSNIDTDVLIRLVESYVGESNRIMEADAPSLSEVSQVEDYVRKSQVILAEMGNELSVQIALIEELIVQNYSRIALELLDAEPDSIEDIEEVISILGKSLLIDPDDQLIRMQYDLARNYILGLENYASGLLEEALENLDFIYSNNEDYANGTARQILYEAHSQLGLQSYSEGDYASALTEFEIAELIALDDQSARLRTFEAHSNVAKTLGQLERFIEGSNSFYSAVLVSGSKSNFATEFSNTLNLIYEAEISASNANFVRSYELYTEALVEEYTNSDIVEYIVVDGDYLAQIASRLLSTVSAIRLTNNLSESRDIVVGLQLSIPFFGGEE